MQFHSFNFALFLLGFVVVFHATRRYGELARFVIVIASVAFYASWSVAYVPILLASSLVTFGIARAIGATADEDRRRRLLWIGVVFCVGLLALFKYANFVLANAYAVMHVAGWTGTEWYVDLIFPVGISFYTFVNIAYLVDVYGGDLAPKQRAIDFLAPMTFFPQLLSGPIVRAPQQFPQFEKLAGIQAATYRYGLALIFVGIAKKALAGLLDPIASPVFAAHATASSLTAWTGVLAYTAQIYADFSGYIDIAIGAALMIGIELPRNFNLPYVATSPADFWRRWHITLSTWIRDYGFMPLALKLRNAYAALLVTWILVGLWHGAEWTYVAYGLYHGLAIIATRWIGTHAPDALHARADRWWLSVPRRALTFVIVAIGFVVFRATTLAGAAKLAGSMFVSSQPSTFDADAKVTLVLVIAALVVPHLIDAALLHCRETVVRWWFWPLAILATTFAILFGTGTAGYIYMGF